MNGGLGGDYLSGGSGLDTTTYENATIGLTVSLIDATQNTGEAYHDTYNSIENITGSAFNDILTGNATTNVINGGNGNDRINGHLSRDTLTGNAGEDTFVLIKA